MLSPPGGPRLKSAVMLTEAQPTLFTRAPAQPPAAPCTVAVECRRVLAITSNLAQASSRLRIAALEGPLLQRGYALDVRVFPRDWTTRRALLASAGEYHAVILQRKLLDPWNWRLLKRAARRVVFDVDDAVRYHAGRVGPYSLIRTAMRFAATTRNVDHVVAGNPHLAEMFHARGCAVTVIPTAIDPLRYRVKRHETTDAPRLVWIGSRSTVGYLRRFLPTLEAAARQTPGLRLLTIADERVRSRAIPVEHIPWSLAGECDALCRGDIGIAPTPRDRWTLGKCGFKILQYMAAGLPVVASPVGANAGLVRPGETGFLPERPAEWCDAISALARDTALRRRMGVAGRAIAEQQYRVDDAADVWAGLLAE